MVETRADGRKDYPINHGTSSPENFLAVSDIGSKLEANHVVSLDCNIFIHRMLQKSVKVLWPGIHLNFILP